MKPSFHRLFGITSLLHLESNLLDTNIVGRWSRNSSITLAFVTKGGFFGELCLSYLKESLGEKNNKTFRGLETLTKFYVSLSASVTKSYLFVI